jgi:hypothetical protein
MVQNQPGAAQPTAASVNISLQPALLQTNTARNSTYDRALRLSLNTNGQVRVYLRARTPATTATQPLL